MGRNRKVTCLVCGKCMRSDKLKAHSLTHTDLLSLPEDEIKEKLKACHAAKLERESQAAKVRKLEEIAVEEGLTSPQQPDAERSPDKETVRKDILQNINAKIELGGMVARIIAEEDAPEQCLSPEQRDALQLFRRRQFQTRIANVEQDEVSTPPETAAEQEGTTPETVVVQEGAPTEKAAVEEDTRSSHSQDYYNAWSDAYDLQHQSQNYGSVPEANRHRCRICGYSTKWKFNLTRHMVTCAKKYEKTYRDRNDERSNTIPSVHDTSKQSTDPKPPRIECSIAGCSSYTEGCERCTDYDGRYVLDDDQNQAREYDKFQAWKEDRRRNSTTGYATYPQTGYATYPQTGYATYPQTGYATYPQSRYATYNHPFRYNPFRYNPNSSRPLHPKQRWSE